MNFVSSSSISNEFEYSTKSINYRVQNHRSVYHNNTFEILNMAEITAMKEEQNRLEEEMMKKQSLEEGVRKAKENLKIYKNKKQKDDLNGQFESDKKITKEKMKELNENLRQKALNSKKKKYLEKNSECIGEQIVEDKIKVKNISNLADDIQKDFHTFSFHDVEKEEKEPVPMAKESIYKDLNQHLNSNVINLRDDIDTMIRNRFENLNRNEIEKDKNNYEENLDITEEINKNIENVRAFRKTGLFSSNTIKSNPKSDRKSTGDQKLVNNSNDVNSKNSKNELEKRRYVKALKNLMIEKFKEKSIIIPNICSCGQLQRKLDTLLEDKNVSVYSVINIECANNCIYYKKNQEYHKALSDIINSVKNLKYDSFIK